MITRKVCLVGLAATTALLAGCATQYRNSSACQQEMRSRLADASHGELSVTHTAVAYRGSRVVVEGHLEATHQAVADAASDASDAKAALASAASAPSEASAASAEPKPTTPVDVLTQKLGIKKPKQTPAAAECTFDASGLKSFRWLAPASLAKTMPDPGAPSD
ncbi:MAG: hypothetical protein EPN70_23540 [Paraburkholderia sp.]|uniref:hypothetical protein n=1 Tax=Paraburkholderia sp. TaxID=1926495 RepID=UPI00120FF34D|nr:hypothetical protein [Paraburkholderia sp.]TAM00043.1 MAG: hypothetical protein EPN70_23540 [Paraburkholderia sp.]TAM32677.1 MAG: hypothetical protein EPN59_01910 [Paraburkholderia sp.]